MNFLTDFLGRVIRGRNPLAVRDMGVSTDLTTISAESVTFVTGAAGFSQIATLDKAPILNRTGSKVGSYWRTPDNLRMESGGRPNSNTSRVTAVTETNGSAACVIQDTYFNLEQLFESPAAPQNFVLVLRDLEGNELYGFIAGVSASGNLYTVSVMSSPAGSTQNWNGTLADFEFSNSVTYQIYEYDTSFAWVTGTVLTREVEYSKAVDETVQLKNMANGDYAIDYDNGRILYKKATTGTSDTCGYLTRGSSVVADISEFPAAAALSDTFANPTTTTVGAMGMVWDRVLSVWKRMQNNLFFFRDYGTHFTPNDGTAAYTSSTTITCAGFPFTVDDTYCDVLSIVYKPTGGLWTILENGKDGVSMSASSNVITVTGAGTPFASGDTYRIAIRYQNKGYNAASNSGNTTESNPLSQQYVEVELIDTTNVAAATTYYPSADGQVMDGYSTLWLQGMTSGGVTTTVEATLDDASSPDFLDITPYFSNMIVNPNAVAASYLDVNFLIRALDLRVKKWRVKSVTSDGTNAVQYHAKMTSI